MRVGSGSTNTTLEENALTRPILASSMIHRRYVKHSRILMFVVVEELVWPHEHLNYRTT